MIQILKKWFIDVVKLSIKQTKLYLSLFAIAALLSTAKAYNTNIFILTIFFILIIAGLLIGKRQVNRKTKLLCYSVSLFVLFHLVVFPLCYYGLIKYDKKSIQIKNEVISGEKESAVSDLESEYRPTLMANNASILDTLLSTNQPLLDTPLAFIYADNILTLNGYFIAKSDTMLRTDMPRPANDCVALYDSKGKLAVKLYGSVKERSSTRLYEFLSEFRNFYKSQTSSFAIKRQQIVTEKELWTYARILPFSLNIFNSDNIKPVSKLASVVNYLHNFVVYSLLLTIIGTFLIDLLITNKQK
jgi:hypothetical protein